MTELTLVTTVERLVRVTVLPIVVARVKRAVTGLPLITTVERLVRVTVLPIAIARIKRALTELPLVTTVERLVRATVPVIVGARVKRVQGQENNPSEPVFQALQHNRISQVTLQGFSLTQLQLPDTRAKPTVWLNQCLPPHHHAYPAHRHFLKFKLGLNLPV